MASIEQRINRAWYDHAGRVWAPLWLLWPLELLFRSIAALRRRFLRAQLCGAPVIVVGNIAVGGSGKTPTVLAVVEHLRQRGLRPGIVSRGYGGDAASYPLLVTAETPAAQAGDEPCLMARRCGLPVAVAPDRLAAARLLVERHACNIIVSDDGLQHYRLARDIEILVIDGQRGFGNRHCLPLGPLRESVTRANEVDICVVNGATMLPDISGFEMRLKGDCLVNLVSGERRAIADFLVEHPRVYGLAGIGHPQRFFDTLIALGFELDAKPFPDHHRFSASDLRFDKPQPVVMTEKDAVKCAQFGDEQCWMLPVEGRLDPNFYDALDACLAAPMIRAKMSL